MAQSFTTQPINGVARSFELGIYATRADNITLDAYLPNNEIFKFIYVGGAGDIVIEKIDNSVVFIPGVPAGSKIPLLGRRVLADDGVNPTTATNMVWFGGV